MAGPTKKANKILNDSKRLDFYCEHNLDHPKLYIQQCAGSIWGPSLISAPPCKAGFVMPQVDAYISVWPVAPSRGEAAGPEKGRSCFLALESPVTVCVLSLMFLYQAAAFPSHSSKLNRVCSCPKTGGTIPHMPLLRYLSSIRAPSSELPSLDNFPAFLSSLIPGGCTWNFLQMSIPLNTFNF